MDKKERTPNLADVERLRLVVMDLGLVVKDLGQEELNDALYQASSRCRPEAVKLLEKAMALRRWQTHTQYLRG
jgi:hypothetical protein